MILLSHVFDKEKGMTQIDDVNDMLDHESDNCNLSSITNTQVPKYLSLCYDQPCYIII